MKPVYVDIPLATMIYKCGQSFEQYLIPPFKSVLKHLRDIRKLDKPVGSSDDVTIVFVSCDYNTSTGKANNATLPIPSVQLITIINSFSSAIANKTMVDTLNAELPALIAHKRADPIAHYAICMMFSREGPEVVLMGGSYDDLKNHPQL